MGLLTSQVELGGRGVGFIFKEGLHGSRVHGAFGEDAGLARKLVRAYIEGFQDGGNGIGKGSVVAVVEHWAGYGAAKDGFDSHNAYGQYAVFPGNNFEYHLEPFEGAFAARTGGVMPTCSICPSSCPRRWRKWRHSARTCRTTRPIRCTPSSSG